MRFQFTVIRNNLPQTHRRGRKVRLAFEPHGVARRRVAAAAPLGELQQRVLGDRGQARERIRHISMRY